MNPIVCGSCGKFLGIENVIPSISFDRCNICDECLEVDEKFERLLEESGLTPT